MEGKNSYGTSWADQWDYDQDLALAEQTKKSIYNGGSRTSRYGKKVEHGYDKTKAVASTGVKKVKEGTSVGIQWIKEKYHRTTHKS
ncbi:hypothetical protein RJ639_037617 [Escallonia herrerae]|uniref:Uncharacterized protein n=1 Tax=Escallonia herrerae TaxID=1293975 RepID=A0AA88WNG3_9ASTE|nr:hypothetical protein RJ639_037617 [Escallonia herrerae]